MNTLKLGNGRELHLKAVNWTAAYHILQRFGGPELLSDEKAILALEGKAAMQAANATEQLFNYCAGWGVTDDPPEDELNELEVLGLVQPNQPHLTRANWVRFVCMENDTEASELIGAVLALSAQKVQEATRQPGQPVQPPLESPDEGSPDALQAELRAQVEMLTAQVATLAQEKAEGAE